MLKKLFLAGVDTFRLNFSHGSHQDHAKVHAAIRALEAELRSPIGILQDLQGPKIRVGTIKDGKIHVAAGDKIRFIPDGGRRRHVDPPAPSRNIRCGAART
jgi:pyruvate kinase